MSILLQGHDDAMIGEDILLNTTILDENITKLEVLLPESLYLHKALNYELGKVTTKNHLYFDVKKFKFKNNLALVLRARKSSDSNEVQAKVIANYSNGEKKESLFTIKILIPKITVKLSRTKNSDMNLRIVKNIPYLPTYIKSFDFIAVDHESGKKVPIKIERFTFEEYLKIVDDLPDIFTIETAVKKIIIESENPVYLKLQIKYDDHLKNHYQSNWVSIKLTPERIMIKDEIHSLIQTAPMIFTEGFQFTHEAMAVA